MSKYIAGMARAVVISFNWKTRETFHTVFELGKEFPDPLGTACGWAHEGSFLWRDFPARDGWEHFAHGNGSARDIHGKIMTDELLERGTQTLKIPR